MAISDKDLNAQQQAMAARLSTVEAQAAAQAIAIKALTQVVAGLPGGSAITSIAPVMGMISGLPGSMTKMVKAPGVPAFQQMGLAIALSSVGLAMPSSLIDGAVAQLGTVASGATAALGTAQAALVTAEAMAPGPARDAAIADAQGSIDLAQAQSDAAGASGTAAAACSAVSNSSIGKIASMVKTA